MSKTMQPIIVRYSDLPDSESLRQSLDAIFFDASNTKSFANDAVRNAFRMRWLGRYLIARPDLAHLLFVGDRMVPDALAGYVVGAHDDPAKTDRYDDVGYFHLLGDVTRYFPAHLHINLRQDMRGKGLGSVLIEQFVSDVTTAGLPGVHIVTGARLRNVGFYQQNGFSFTHRFTWKDNELVLLGRKTSVSHLSGA